MYEIDQHGFSQLDILEGYKEGGQGMYDRKQISADMEDGSTEQAWIYTYNGEEVGQDEICSGSWRTRSPDDKPQGFNPDYL